MIAWLKKKWKIVVGIVVGLITTLSVMLRIRGQKGILENANKAHEAENKANDKARRDLSDGLTRLDDEAKKKLTDAELEFANEEERLAKRKEDAAKNAAKSDDLAKDFADLLDAELVDADDS